MQTGSYIGHQILQILHTSARAAGNMKNASDKKGKSGGWAEGIVGFLFVAMTRAVAAVILIPLHAAVALSQPNQSKATTVTRALVLAVSLVAFAALFLTASHSGH